MSAVEQDKATREIELKLELDVEHVALLRQHPLLSRDKAPTDHRARLHAVYYDTPDEALRRAGLSLRVRRENGRAIQTVKADRRSGRIALDRSEWQCVVKDGFEPGAAKGTPLAPFLADPAIGMQIAPRFVIDTTRQTYMIRREGAEIELALDEAKISVGARREQFCEIELELKSGEPATLFALARDLAIAVPLRVSLTAKSERGYSLLGPAALSPVRAEAVVLNDSQTSGDAFKTIARSCLSQILRNETALRRTRDPEALHQLRVGLRRLRAATSLFKSMLDDKESRALQEEHRWISRQLGRARDLDVLTQNIRKAKATDPVVNAVAAEHIEALRVDAYDALLAMLSGRRFADGLLQTAAWIEIGAWHRAKKQAQPAETRAAKELERRWKRIRKRSMSFADLDAEGRHGLRIDIKKFRYGTEFFASHYEDKGARKRQRSMLACCGKSQDALGDLNDLSIEAIVRPLLGITEPVDDKRRRKSEKKATNAARKFCAIEPFWR